MITLTEMAAEKVKTLAREGNAENKCLRIKLVGGGCCGMTYKLEWDDAAHEGDRKFETNGITVIVDARSCPYLEGTTIDFVRRGLEEGFIFNNPNRTSSCGCGMSHSF